MKFKIFDFDFFRQANFLEKVILEVIGYKWRKSNKIIFLEFVKKVRNKGIKIL